MAKAARTPEVAISDRLATKFRRDILERLDNIKSARGKFMNAAKRERDAMQEVYETMAASGVSQKVSKLYIKIYCAEEKIKGWMTDLDVENRKVAQKLVKALGDKRQLQLFGDLPKPEKAPKAVLRDQTGNGHDLVAAE